MNRIIIIIGLMLFSTITKGQGIAAFEFLYSLSDEIIVVKITNERTASESLIQCKSYVDARIVEGLKVKRLLPDEKIIHFVRILSCNEKGNVPEGLLLDKSKQYIIFLSSESPGYDTIGNHKEYALSDYILGIQEYSEDLAKYLRSKQRLKR
ncbi:MAG: hypothetical protein HOP30_15890 [Cyclobacteriaceae bacterium]|nr:hypothetical protein [Cyclobacteriaceae bacterium]